MDAIVPFDAVDPKRRLSSVLEPDERRAFAGAMLADVLDALAETAASTRVVATAPIDLDVPVAVDDRPLTVAVNDALAGGDLPTAVVMADLPLVTAAALDRLFAAEGDVVLVPGVGGGTNAVVVRDGAFHVDYHGCSIRDHRRIAAEAGLSTATVDSFGISLDVDEPADLAEVVLHGRGVAASWLGDHGVAVTTDDDGRVGVDRTPRD